MIRAAFFGFLAIGTIATSGQADQTTKPNILLVIGDDMTWHDCGAYGSDVVRTPNIDRLAADGMRFDRAFTSTAMCAPTRQQLYTGIYPVRNGAWPNHSRVYEGTKSFVHYLRALGYRVGLSGKSHCKPPESYPWENVPASGDDKTGGLGEFINRDRTQPYCLVFASNEPHTPWSKGDPTAYPPEKIQVPPYLVDTPETREELSKYYAEITYLDGQVGRCMDLVAQSGSADNTIFIFTSEQGSAFPFGGKWTCYENGLHTALIFRWPARVKAGTSTDAMVQYVDVVPTLVEAAGGTVPKGLDGRSFFDVLMGKADAHRDYVYGAHTTRGIINGSECYPVRSIRSDRYKLILNPNHETAFTNVPTQTGKQPFTSWLEADEAGRQRAKAYQHRPAEEFYDLDVDPYELTNLIDQAEHGETIDQLRNKLHAWMKQQGDEGNATEMKARERQGSGKKRNPTKPKKDRRKKKAT